jgi:hypothetical protein
MIAHQGDERLVELGAGLGGGAAGALAPGLSGVPGRYRQAPVISSTPNSGLDRNAPAGSTSVIAASVSRKDQQAVRVEPESAW